VGGYDLYLKSDQDPEPSGKWNKPINYDKLFVAQAVAEGILRNDGWYAIIVDHKTGTVLQVDTRELLLGERFQFTGDVITTTSWRFTVWIEADTRNEAIDSLVNTPGYRDHDFDEEND